VSFEPSRCCAYDDNREDGKLKQMTLCAAPTRYTGSSNFGWSGQDFAQHLLGWNYSARPRAEMIRLLNINLPDPSCRSS